MENTVLWIAWTVVTSIIQKNPWFLLFCFRRSSRVRLLRLWFPRVVLSHVVFVASDDYVRPEYGNFFCVRLAFRNELAVASKWFILLVVPTRPKSCSAFVAQVGAWQVCMHWSAQLCPLDAWPAGARWSRQYQTTQCSLENIEMKMPDNVNSWLLFQ